LEIRDLIVTPVVLFIVYLIAFWVRPSVTDEVNRKYFIPALTFKILGAMAVGFIYQYYYGGGDTFNFHTHGSRHVWEAFVDSPEKGFKLLFSDGSDQIGIYKYSSKIPFFRDRTSFNVIRVASVIDLFTFSAYSATAIGFSVISFIGGWMLFLSFYKSYQHLHRWVAVATLFIPSLFFWGSGLLKDTLTLSLLSAATYFIRQLIIDGKIRPLNIVILLLCLYGIYSIKIYILQTFLPAVLIMFYAVRMTQVKSMMLKVLMLPVILATAVLSSYFIVAQVGAGDQRYSVDMIGKTAKVTAYDIAFQTGRDAGSTYALGELDGSFLGMIRLAPQAINVALFRPYVWEVRNPLMLMSAFESLFFLVITIYVFFNFLTIPGRALLNPDVIFCLVFSLVFAFGVGISTYNFGTLSRYKIPLLPFYMLALVLLIDHSKSARKVAELESTE
jgi:hypothetical protein